jgi:hypothetical protein
VQARRAEPDEQVGHEEQCTAGGDGPRDPGRSGRHRAQCQAVDEHRYGQLAQPVPQQHVRHHPEQPVTRHEPFPQRPERRDETDLRAEEEPHPDQEGGLSRH